MDTRRPPETENEEDLSQYLVSPEDIDRPSLPDATNRSQSQGQQPNRFNRFAGSVRSYAAKYGTLAVRYVKAEGKEQLVKAGARQLIGSEAPGVGNAVMGAYSAWDTYKDFRSFIAYARELEAKKIYEQIALQEQKVAKGAELLQQKIERAANDIKHLSNGKKEYISATNEWELVNRPQIRDLRVDMARLSTQRENLLHNNSPSLETVLKSQATPEQQQKFWADSRAIAQRHEQNVMKGSAQDRYHWMLNQASQELGEEALSVSKNPHIAISFDRFAAENLRARGFPEPEIQRAVGCGNSCSVLSPDGSGFSSRAYSPNSRLLHQLYDRTVSPVSQDLNRVRAEIAQFHQENPIAGKLRLTNEEVGVQRSMQRVAQFEERQMQSALKNTREATDQWTREAAAQFAKGRMESAREVFDAYRANPEMKLSTTQEYQVELARIHEHSSHLQNWDQRTSVKLMMAGHRADEVTTALDKSSPFAKQAGHVTFQEGEYGKRVVNEAKDLIDRDAAVQQRMREILEKKQMDSAFEQETRLDKLGLDHRDTPSVRPSPEPQTQRQRLQDIDPQR
jgi:hypothetical protein